MRFQDIARIRLMAQQVTDRRFKKPAALLGYMGAMQAQDFQMALWAIGLRLKEGSAATVLKAYNQGEILRTHVLRPTWHFVSAKDICWLLELSRTRVLSAQKSRDRQLGLDEKLYRRSNRLIEKALQRTSHLTREELMTVLQDAKINTADNRSAHFLFRAELDKIIGSGPMIGSKLSYALLSERVKKQEAISREEAIQKLALQYFNSRFPATVEDFAWWSGLSLKEAKQGVGLNHKKFISEKVKDKILWLPADFQIPSRFGPVVRLLPAFDEFTICYKDRSASLPVTHQGRSISTNGIFYPLIIVNGQVKGLWKKKTIKNGLVIELEFFGQSGKTIRSRALEEAEKYAAFNGVRLQQVKNSR